jgi:hypothetical protein
VPITVELVKKMPFVDKKLRASRASFRAPEDSHAAAESDDIEEEV